jgi:hypothetical protein
MCTIAFWVDFVPLLPATFSRHFYEGIFSWSKVNPLRGTETCLFVRQGARVNKFGSKTRCCWWRTSLKLYYHCVHKTIQDMKTRRLTQGAVRCNRRGLGMGSRVYGYGALHLGFRCNHLCIYARRHCHVHYINIPCLVVTREGSTLSVSTMTFDKVEIDGATRSKKIRSMGNPNSKGASHCL